jgi:hypothetical protein
MAIATRQVLDVNKRPMPKLFVIRPENRLVAK